MTLSRLTLLYIAGDAVPLSGSIDFGPTKTVDSKPSYSVLIGINGVGKSRLLSQIAAAFIYLAQKSMASTKVQSRRRFPFSALRYQLDNHLVDLRAKDGILTARVNGRRVDVENVPLPKSVVALTATAFDKFPVPRSFAHLPDIYAYLGLRDVVGRSSIKSLLYRSLDRLVEFIESPSHGQGDQRSLAAVFDILKYEPRLKVRYELRRSLPISRAAADGAEALNVFLNDEDRALMPSRDAKARVRKAISAGDFSIHDIVNAYNAASSANAPFVDLSMTFSDPLMQLVKSSEAVNDDLKLLRRTGILTLREVQLWRKGEMIELMDASSGEVSLAAQFIGLAATVEQNSLVLIDEPEVSLHPEWQRKYLDLIESCFGTLPGLHFVIATHSPLILGDIPKDNSTIIALDGSTSTDNARQISGESADFVLINAFGVASPTNYYLRDMVARALLLARNNEFASVEFCKLMERLLKIVTSIEQSPIRTIIYELDEARSRFGANR